MESNQLSEDEKKFYEELFSLYDTENRGDIDIDRFIKVTKEKMPPDQWKNDQQVRLLLIFKPHLLILTLTVTIFKASRVC